MNLEDKRVGKLNNKNNEKNIEKNSFIKGAKGYWEAGWKRNCAICLIMFGISFGILGIGIFITGTKFNYLTIAAVLGMLPAARTLISAIMFYKAKAYTPEKDLYEEIESTGCCNIIYELYMTGYSKSFAVAALAADEGGISALLSDEKADAEGAADHVKTLMEQNGFKGRKIKFYKTTEADKFMARLKYLAQNGNDSSDNTELLELMKQISL